MSMVLCACGNVRQIPPWNANGTIRGSCLRSDCTQKKNINVRLLPTKRNVRPPDPGSLDDFFASHTPLVRKAG
jgi:hypothetical protein